MSNQFPGTYAECDSHGRPVGEPFTIHFLKRRPHGATDDALYEVAQRTVQGPSWRYVSGVQIQARLADGRWRRLDADSPGTD